MRQSKSSITQIAACLVRSKSTISRELSRNQSPPGQYWPDTASIKTNERRRRGCIIDKTQNLMKHITTKLCCHYWTPEQIAGDLKANQKELPYVSHETIYQWLYAPKKRLNCYGSFSLAISVIVASERRKQLVKSELFLIEPQFTIDPKWLLIKSSLVTGREI